MTTMPVPKVPVLSALGRARSRSARETIEFLVRGVLILCASFSILTTFTIIVVLLTESAKFFGIRDAAGERIVPVSEFFLSTTWSPLLGAEKHFGVWPLVAGTVLVSAVAALLALPLGLITAIYLSEYAPRRVRTLLKPVLEILAGVPTVVYGFFALTVITPSLQWLDIHVRALFTGAAADMQSTIGMYNALGAGLAVGVMILPIVCSLSEDALQAVPRSLREGAYALGSTRLDVSLRVVTPAALSGIIASFLLAISRAVGETMIVALAAGGLARMTIDPREQVLTMTGYMVQIFLGDAGAHSVEYYSSYAVAAVLFVMTLSLTMLGHRVMSRFREVYE